MVHDDRRSLRAESVLVGVATDGSDTWHLKVKLGDALTIACTFGKGDHEGTKAAVDVTSDVVALSKGGELWNWVLGHQKSQCKSLTTMPSGKLGAEPTSIMVLGLLESAIALLLRLT